MTVTAGSVFDVVLVVVAARVAWSAGNTIVGHAAGAWDRWLYPCRCPRCGQRIVGLSRAHRHVQTVHGPEIEAEQVVNAEMGRQVLGSLFDRIRGTDD